MSSKEFKVVLAGAYGSGKTTFASQISQAKSDKKKIVALKTVIYPVKLWTSGGSVSLKLYDTELHAKGGIPDAEFFRQADAAIVFYDTTIQSSYDALEEWHNAVQDGNSRKGSAPLPVIIVGTKIDLVKDRAVKPEDIVFAHTKNLPYLEISSKANHNVETLLLGICRALLGRSTQLTDKPELEAPSTKVDPEVAMAAMKEYTKAGKK